MQLRRALTQDILRMTEVQLGGRKVGRHAPADTNEKASAHVLEKGPLWLRTYNVFKHVEWIGDPAGIRPGEHLISQ